MRVWPRICSDLLVFKQWHTCHSLLLPLRTTHTHSQTSTAACICVCVVSEISYVSSRLLSHCLIQKKSVYWICLQPSSSVTPIFPLTVSGYQDILLFRLRLKYINLHIIIQCSVSKISNHGSSKIWAVGINNFIIYEMFRRKSTVRNHQLYSSQNFHSGSQYWCLFPVLQNTNQSCYCSQSFTVSIYVGSLMFYPFYEGGGPAMCLWTPRPSSSGYVMEKLTWFLSVFTITVDNRNL